MKPFKSFDAAWNWCQQHAANRHCSIVITAKRERPYYMRWFGHTLLMVEPKDLKG